MPRNFELLIVTLLTFLSVALAECPNACSAHGKCGAYDMCNCFRNWMANDCSERICQFGIAHVDTPKGDLDASGGALTGISTTVVANDQIYPYGTTEQYPDMQDTNGERIVDSAHEYRECSNKGICDRTTGTCSCFEGYDGSACQRASCPVGANGVCSGHGTCQTIAEIANLDNENIYKLWDQDATMGCVCDAGYEGADCSMRSCKVGVDPLYKDNNATIRYSNFTFQFYTLQTGAAIYGNYSLIFYDAYGEDWQTEPIPYDADCNQLTTIIESIPNDVIPAGSVRCYKFPVTPGGDITAYGQNNGVDPIKGDDNFYVKLKYSIAFPENPGKLKQISINKYLDGTRPTLYTSESITSTLGWHIYPNGFIGEDIDMVPDRCYGVTVTLMAGTSTHYLGGLTAATTKLLKTCLGDADGDTSNNVEVYNWDYGISGTSKGAPAASASEGYAFNPHLIKLQDATQYNPSLRVNAVGETSYDSTLSSVPVTNMCQSIAGNSILFGIGANNENLCSNANPPGFYAVLYYDASLSGNFPFRIFNPIAQFYSAGTPFYVYTTTGYLQMVNPDSVVITERPDNSATDRHGYSAGMSAISSYSNKLNVVARPGVTYTGGISCESSVVGQNGALDCLNKNDYVVIFSNGGYGVSTTTTNAMVGGTGTGGGYVGSGTTNGLAQNPAYLNIYQVEKLIKMDVMANGSYVTDTEPHPESATFRYDLYLDYGMNARFVGGDSAKAYGNVYKFYPPTNTPFGGYKYVAPCSGRGLCNYETGTCECFPGYSDDDCSCINAMAV